MTYQEAIDRLRAIAHHGKDIYLICRDQEALALAVAALQTQLEVWRRLDELAAEFQKDHLSSTAACVLGIRDLLDAKPVEKVAGRIPTGKHV